MLIRRFPGVCGRGHVLLVVGARRLNERAHDDVLVVLTCREATPGSEARSVPGRKK